MNLCHLCRHGHIIMHQNHIGLGYLIMGACRIRLLVKEVFDSRGGVCCAPNSVDIVDSGSITSLSISSDGV